MGSGGEGCAIHSSFDSCTTLINCTIAHNHAAGTGTGGVTAGFDSTVTVISSIFWGNDNEEIDLYEAEAVVSYSLIDGGYAGVGNISGDPLFVYFDGDDYHLLPGSPCIDAADGTSAAEFDLEGESRVDDPDTTNTGIGPPWADMGAYEYQP